MAEAAAGLGPVDVFRHAAGLSGVLFLDSALTDPQPTVPTEVDLPRLGRWSFVAADPIHSLIVHSVGDLPDTVAAVAEAFAGLRRLLAELATATIPGLPPFQGGLAGLISYDAGLAALGLPSPPAATPAVPLLALHLYDLVFAYDHDRGRGWFISQGIPAQGPEQRRARAAERLAALLAPAAPSRQPLPPVAPQRFASVPGSPLSGRPAIHTSHPRDRYLEMVLSLIHI